MTITHKRLSALILTAISLAFAFTAMHIERDVTLQAIVALIALGFLAAALVSAGKDTPDNYLNRGN